MVSGSGPGAARATPPRPTPAGLVAVPTLQHPGPGALLRDIDGDGNVDLDDHAIFHGCMSGPLDGLLPGCESADMDQDNAVDSRDFAMFQSAFGG